MSRPAVVFTIWALFLGILLAVLWTIFDWDWLSLVLAGAATAGTLALALLAAGFGRGGVDAAAARAERGAGAAGRAGEARAPVRPLSYASVGVALALGCVLMGLVVGAWLWLVGCGLLALSVAGLVRERRT
jgi:hypothetical protein